MAVIGGGTAVQAALERGALNGLSGLADKNNNIPAIAYGNGTTPVEYSIGPESPNPISVRALSADLLVALNGGTITAGTLGFDVSLDGVNWVDSGVTPVAVPTTNGGYIIVPIKEVVAAVILPARYIRGKIASAASTGAPTVTIRLTC